MVSASLRNKKKIKCLGLTNKQKNVPNEKFPAHKNRWENYLREFSMLLLHTLFVAILGGCNINFDLEFIIIMEC